MTEKSVYIDEIKRLGAKCATLLEEKYHDKKKISELEANLAALAAENAAIKSAIPEPRDIEDDNDNMDDVSLAEDFGFNHAIGLMRRLIPETPATDAFLAEVRAQGVEMLAKNHQSIVNALKGDPLFSDGENLHAAIVSAAVYFAAELRKGGE
ncbi:hypothetical protein Av05_00119 [Escherichia phage Av-05]|uniref:Ead/Ea22-like family protein n=1 Tax=Escherichia phage Av-05 TaxID=1527519 RepID=A0A076G839_9CAUD|nr:hypothetical protein Av05_00119 [Escherichia phage Av-05]AII27662.1 hypothetical protein Av05_00119 [Escherichia phage Av-05]